MKKQRKVNERVMYNGRKGKTERNLIERKKERKNSVGQ